MCWRAFLLLRSMLRFFLNVTGTIADINGLADRGAGRPARAGRKTPSEQGAQPRRCARPGRGRHRCVEATMPAAGTAIDSHEPMGAGRCHRQHLEQTWWRFAWCRAPGGLPGDLDPAGAALNGSQRRLQLLTSPRRRAKSVRWATPRPHQGPHEAGPPSRRLSLLCWR
jgi:hypothetical protein